MTNYRELTPDISYQVSHAQRRAALFREIKTAGYCAAKRTFDIVVSLIGITVALLPMALIALIISADSRGRAIFRQRRVGLNGKLFNVYKFRTMHTFAPSEAATSELKEPYRYITRVGSFLRRTSLDELPQLFNVLKGDMSLVGPRPLIAREHEIHYLRKKANIYSVRPGITGWAQINGRDDVSIVEKVRLDAEYVEKRSLLFDLGILLKTVLVVFRKDGYREGASD